MVIGYIPISNSRASMTPRAITILVFLTCSFAGAEEILFNRDVRPILSENCFQCHGPDEAARAKAADLRLDTEEGSHEYAIVPGEPDESEVVARIFSNDADLRMPPKDSERSLTDEQKATIRKWIEQGAGYEKHWSFNPVVRPAIPKFATARSPIDRFIRHRLESEGHRPAAPATPEALIRRATFTLTGLPPTVEEVDAFLADKSPDAYETVINRLLASPAFGERMASDWLDLARYSDTFGYQVDRDRFVWPWRDWVIDSFNTNKPYDEFITEQLAGDLLPNATREQILATTFSRLHPQKVEGGSVPEEFRIEYVADRAQTVATGLLGLTMECCRCHTHKYDPIQHDEYYKFTAFFDNIDEAGLYSFFTRSVPTPTLTLPTESETEALTNANEAVAKAEQALDQAIESADQELDGKKDVEPSPLTFAEPIYQSEFEGKPAGKNTLTEGVQGNAILLTGDDGVNTKVGNFHRYDPFSVSLWIKPPTEFERAVVFHRSRAWTDAGSRGYQLLIEDGKLSWSLIHFWPGNAIRIITDATIPVDTWTHVTVTNDGSSRASGLKIYVNGTIAETTVVRDNLTKNITGGGGNSLVIGKRYRDLGLKGGAVDRMRVFEVELSDLEARRLATKTEIVEETGEPDSGSFAESPEARSHITVRESTAVQDAREKLHAARKSLCEIQDKLREIMVMRERDTPRTTYRLNRGAYDSPEEEVTPGTPAALPAFDESYPPNRLGLSNWLFAKENPLTSRVAVNRMWQICFSAGLVRTPEDFGSQGAPPTHPDLLDWLADDFRDSGWDMKRMIKQIVMSETFQQSSRNPEADAANVDPENKLLLRFPTYRLPAEMLRDNALAISGRLVRKIGGPPVRPYEIEQSFKPQRRGKGEALYRRSVYTYWKRTGPAPAMMTFDAAKRDVCRVRREHTASPIQAFVLLNGPQYIEAARGLAERLLMGDANEVEPMLESAFRTLTSQSATDQQVAVLRKLYDTQVSYFKEDGKRARSYLSIGDAKPPKDCDAGQLAALTVVVNTLMNFDESVMVR